MARDAGIELNPSAGTDWDPNVKDLGQYLFCSDENIQLAGVLLTRVGEEFGNEEEPYEASHHFLNVIVFCDGKHFKTHYVPSIAKGERIKVEDKRTWYDERKTRASAKSWPAADTQEKEHVITIDKTGPGGLSGCTGPLAKDAAFAVNIPRPDKSYIQLCPWYLRKMGASPYPGSWAFKKWQIFLNAGRGAVQHLIGKRTPIDIAARLDHLIIHELTHTNLVLPSCLLEEPQCPRDEMPQIIRVGGGALDIVKNNNPINGLTSYFWPNCVRKANAGGYDNGVYNADSLAYAALGVRMIKQGIRLEKSGQLTPIASIAKLIRRLLGLGKA